MFTTKQINHAMPMSTRGIFDNVGSETAAT